MFSFPCANCGNLKMLHLEMLCIKYEDFENFKEELEKELREYIKNGLWPNEEYQEEFQDNPSIRGGSYMLSPEEILQFLLIRKKGYRYSLKTCPEFKYRKKDYVDMIKAFCSMPNMLEYLPEDLQEAAEKKIKLLEEGIG